MIITNLSVGWKIRHREIELLYPRCRIAAISEVEAYLPIAGTYSGPCQPFKKQAFVETVDGFQP